MRYITLLFFIILFHFNTLSQEYNNPLIDYKLVDFGIYDTDLLPAKFHLDRRKAVKTFLPENSMAIFYSGKSMVRSNDVDYEFHQDPNFYYLTGLNEPNSALVLFKTPVVLDQDTISELLLIKKRNENSEIWVGKKLGIKGSENFLN
jgi:Xaa-Pro aminopeptidase